MLMEEFLKKLFVEYVMVWYGPVGTSKETPWVIPWRMPQKIARELPSKKHLREFPIRLSKEF